MPTRRVPRLTISSRRDRSCAYAGAAARMSAITTQDRNLDIRLSVFRCDHGCRYRAAARIRKRPDANGGRRLDLLADLADHRDRAAGLFMPELLQAHARGFTFPKAGTTACHHNSQRMLRAKGDFAGMATAYKILA